MTNSMSLKFNVLCDNYLEFERFFEITLVSLNLKRTDFETKKTRILLHFITMCIIAKFWHFIFILGF